MKMEGRVVMGTLMADGGIYAWEPVEGVPYETEPDPEIEEALREAFPDYTGDVVDAGTGQGRYLYSRMDLNGDGREEVFAYTLGSIFCGTGGCNLLLFSPSDDGLALVNNLPITRTPVIVSAERTEGWNDPFRLESGGGAPASYVRHVFDGQTYVEKERLPAEPAPEGTAVLVGELMFEDGASGQATLHFPDNAVTLEWRGEGRATATFEGMNPRDVSVTTAEGVTRFEFDGKPYFYVSDREAAAAALKKLR